MRVLSGIERLLRQRVAEHPSETWIKFRDQEISWEASLSAIQRAANGLLEMGVGPGDRVAILLVNRPEFLWVHFALGMIGAQSVPVNTSQRGAALQHILADSDSVAVVFEQSLREAVLAVRERVPGIRAAVVAEGPEGANVERTLDQLLSAPDREPEVEVSRPAGGTGMMYTSGTTGPPKGVVATGQDSAPLKTILATLDVKPGETMYTALPLFHGNALGMSVIGSILLDAKLALGERFHASRFIEECRRVDAVQFNALGGMISILMKQPPRDDDRDNPVRTVLSAACPPNCWRELEARFGVRIVEFYGMVDAPGFLLNDQGRVGSMGKPIGGVEFLVVDDRDRPLPPGQVGELVFRHPKGALTKYHKLDESTSEAYRGGWFHSGDLAEIDDEGFFYFRGRKKASIRRRGENISAWEIETALNEHPGVLESAAYAVPSELGEDEVMVAVVKTPGREASPEELLDFCRGRMAYYAIPRYVEIVNELPKTGTQRIQYAELRARGISRGAWDREKAGYRIER